MHALRVQIPQVLRSPAGPEPLPWRPAGAAAAAAADPRGGGAVAGARGPRRLVAEEGIRVGPNVERYVFSNSELERIFSNV